VPANCALLEISGTPSWRRRSRVFAPTHMPSGGVLTCRTDGCLASSPLGTQPPGRFAVVASSGDRRSQAEAFGSCHTGVRGSGTGTPRPACHPISWRHSNAGVMAHGLSPWPARLLRNARFGHYSPNHEARDPPGGQIRQAHRHPGSAEGRCGRQALPGSPLPVRLWARNRPAHQLAHLRRCPVLRVLAWPAQIPAQALPGLRNTGHDPARPPKLLPRLRIRAGPGHPAGTQPVL
jgi:hypothetical protein